MHKELCTSKELLLQQMWSTNQLRKAITNPISISHFTITLFIKGLRLQSPVLKSTPALCSVFTFINIFALLQVYLCAVSAYACVRKHGKWANMTSREFRTDNRSWETILILQSFTIFQLTIQVMETWKIFTTKSTSLLRNRANLSVFIISFYGCTSKNYQHLLLVRNESVNTYFKSMWKTRLEDWITSNLTKITCTQLPDL